MPVSKVNRVTMWQIVLSRFQMGIPILLCEGQSDGFSLGLVKWEKRAIEEPVAEGGIRGSREGFIESLQVTMSLLRRIIKSPALKLQSMNIGNIRGPMLCLPILRDWSIQPWLKRS